MSITGLCAIALPILFDVAFKGTVVLVVAFALAPCLGRASAGTRHLLWASTFVAILAIPIVSCLLPARKVSVDVRAFAGLANPPHLWVVETPVHPPARGPRVLDEAKRQPTLIANSDRSLPAALSIDKAPIGPPFAVAPVGAAVFTVLVWFTGVLLSGAWLCVAWLKLGRVAHCCQQISSGSLLERLTAVAATLEIRRPVTLVLSPGRAVPMTWGLWRPVVLLPEEALCWTGERLRAVLVHELGHVVRWDCLLQMVGHLARGLLWFHPLAWLAVRQLRIEQENACDDLVLESGVGAADYAEHLLAVTAGIPAHLWTVPVAPGIGRYKRLQRRLTGLLDEGRNHRPVRRREVRLVAAFTLALVVALGTMAVTLTTSSAQAVRGPDDGGQPGTDRDESLIKRLGEVRRKLAQNYVTPIDDRALTESALKGFLQGLDDPYANYLSADDLKGIDALVKGDTFKANIAGIGAKLKLAGEHITIDAPLENSPALKSGLRAGDRIEAIDGKSTAGLGLAEAVHRIQGAAGSDVKLKVIHPDGVVQEMTITRAQVPVKSVYGFRRGEDGKWQFLLDAGHKIGYAGISQFSNRTAADVAETIKALQNDGLGGLILDLRGCPGGLLEQAVEVCKLFLDKGTILTTRGPNQTERVWKADGKATLGDFPLVILLNAETASAAEVVAGSLRDHDRAVLIGTRSLGKGSVQSVIKLDEGGALKVTTAYHYLPSGRNIQKRPGERTWGVDPTDGYYIPLTAAQATALREDAERRALFGPKTDEPAKPPMQLTPRMIEEKHADPQLAAALRTLVARVTRGAFIKVGKDNAFMLDQTIRLQDMRKRREQLKHDMSRIEREIANLQTVVGEHSVPNPEP